ncbi:MAG TPA: hypothetical protein VHZ55_02170 [Bryobacteraceae bacterium]|nr:hypothetical protein [Bryobacteraceae bacterium]
MAYESQYELEAEFESEFEGEGEFEGEFEGEAEFEAEGEFEGEFETEFEGEFEAGVNPIRKIYSDAMMEHLGELAAEAESEQEAVEHFLPLIGMAASKLLPVAARAVAPMARKALPRMAKAISQVTPQLTKGVGRIARTLHVNPQTRHLLRAVPSVARRTVGALAKQAAKGVHVSPQAAVRTLARQTRKVLGTPLHRAHALRRHHALERRFHTRLAPGLVRPHSPYGRHYVATTGSPYRTAALHTGPGARYGRFVGGRCVCPSCGVHASSPALASPIAAPAPAYCRCCGQVLR